MALLPESTNARYTGAAWVPPIAGVLTLGMLIPSLIHMFAPDGGAFRIAALDAAAGRQTIIGIFAWAGATQFVYALVMLGVVLRWRDFLPPMLLLTATEQMLIALNGWVLKPSATGHHPPQMYAVFVSIPLLLALAGAAARPRRPA